MEVDGEIRRLRPLAGGNESASVELVEIGGRLFVLKRVKPVRIAGEREFQRTMAAAGLPYLETPEHPALADDEMLLEYVAGSPTIGSSTFERAAAWGAAVGGLHALSTPGFERFEGAAPAPASWPAYLDWLIERALSTPRDTENRLPGALLREASKHLNELRGFCPARFALLHGDLHANNALVRGSDVVLFDRASGIWSGPAVFDIALVASEGYPGARYGVDRPGDPARWEAFVSGYGELPSDEAPYLDHFALAHGLIRYPTPFVPELGEIIEAALARIRA